MAPWVSIRTEEYSVGSEQRQLVPALRAMLESAGFNNREGDQDGK